MNRHLLTICCGLMLTTILTLAGCASGGSTEPNGLSGAQTAVGKVELCKAGDKQVASQAECLQDDSACYRLKSGNWCTGPRGMTCPSGSSPLPKDAPCPQGSKCFEAAAGLNCLINLK